MSDKLKGLSKLSLNESTSSPRSHDIIRDKAATSSKSEKVMVPYRKDAVDESLCYSVPRRSDKPSKPSQSTEAGSSGAKSATKSEGTTSGQLDPSQLTPEKHKEFDKYMEALAKMRKRQGEINRSITSTTEQLKHKRHTRKGTKDHTKSLEDSIAYNKDALGKLNQQYKEHQEAIEKY